MTEVEMTSLLIRLADLGITGVKVRYDGGGDSGAIEWMGFTKEECETPEDVNDNIDDWQNDANLSKLVESQDYENIQDFAYKILDDIEDWWNNEGGFGNLCISVPSGKYIINNHVRVTDTEDFFHDGSLLEKAEDE
jgi:hypothetical protein